MQFRPALASDAAAIDTITEQAFKQAAHTDHTEHLIVRALREADALKVSMVAEQGGQLIGHVAISPVSISDGTVNWFGLGPLSVLPKQQRKGVGSELMIQSLAQLKTEGAAGCVVLGDPDFYARFGFKTVATLRFADVPSPYFQVLCFDEHLPEGEVRYHPAFYLFSQT